MRATEDVMTCRKNVVKKKTLQNVVSCRDAGSRLVVSTSFWHPFGEGKTSKVDNDMTCDKTLRCPMMEACFQDPDSDLFSRRFREGIFLPEISGEIHPETALFPSSVCAPCSTEKSIFEARKGRKGCREEGRKRGDQQRGQKGKKDAWKQVRIRPPTPTSDSFPSDFGWGKWTLTKETWFPLVRWRPLKST